MSSPASPDFRPVACRRRQLEAELRRHARTCIECGLCQRQCRFLQKYGSPKQIAQHYDPASEQGRELAFKCSLCGLCRAVCPAKIGLDPAAMFLEMRREAVCRGTGALGRHRTILAYERRGTSRLLSYYGLPEGCDTVLFPGCALPGTRPETLKALFRHLQRGIPALGIVLDCCTKPSHDLGRDDYFRAMFGEMRDYLLRKGVRRVLVACPNCHQIFSRYGEGLAVETVYEYMAENGLPGTGPFRGCMTLHDPCGTRFEVKVQQAVRRIVTRRSLHVEEMKHHGSKTLCCGEGGSVGFLDPELSGAWSRRRRDEAEGRTILTYCAGCAHTLNGLTPTRHLLDLVFAPEETMAGRVKVSKSPFTYWNRFRLKRYFARTFRPPAPRERACRG